MLPQAPRKRIQYLNNADMLREIHNSKMTFCSKHNASYFSYDTITDSVANITFSMVEAARHDRLKRLLSEQLRIVQKQHNCTPKQAAAYIERTDTLITIDDVQAKDVVIRVMTDEHIPFADENETEKVKTNFKPFKHVVLRDNGEIEEVVWSHWKGSIELGSFCMTHGRLSNELGKMFTKLAEKIATKGCYRGYSFVDEMCSSACFQLTKNALLFDESRETVQLNPFAYYTTFVNNAFKAVLNEEKKRRNLRDDLLEEYGIFPSTTRMVEIEESMIAKFQAASNVTVKDDDGPDQFLTYDDE